MDYQDFFAGNQAVLTDIIRDYRDGLLLYLNGIVQNVTIAEELTEEVFVKLVMKRPRFSADSSFKTWLYAIGRNLAISYQRRQKHIHIPLENCPELTDDEKNLERQYIQKEQYMILRNAMKGLKLEYRQVLWLIYFEGFSQKETARIMGKSVHNVETLVYRARQALKAKLLEEGFEYEIL